MNEWLLKVFTEGGGQERQLRVKMENQDIEILSSLLHEALNTVSRGEQTAKEAQPFEGEIVCLKDLCNPSYCFTKGKIYRVRCDVLWDDRDIGGNFSKLRNLHDFQWMEVKDCERTYYNGQVLLMETAVICGVRYPLRSLFTLQDGFCVEETNLNINDDRPYTSFSAFQTANQKLWFEEAHPVALEKYATGKMLCAASSSDGSLRQGTLYPIVNGIWYDSKGCKHITETDDIEEICAIYQKAYGTTLIPIFES